MQDFREKLPKYRADLHGVSIVPSSISPWECGKITSNFLGFYRKRVLCSLPEPNDFDSLHAHSLHLDAERSQGTPLNMGRHAHCLSIERHLVAQSHATHASRQWGRAKRIAFTGWYRINCLFIFAALRCKCQWMTLSIVRRNRLSRTEKKGKNIQQNQLYLSVCQINITITQTCFVRTCKESLRIGHLLMNLMYRKRDEREREKK